MLACGCCSCGVESVLGPNAPWLVAHSACTAPMSFPRPRVCGVAAESLANFFPASRPIQDAQRAAMPLVFPTACDLVIRVILELWCAATRGLHRLCLLRPFLIVWLGLDFLYPAGVPESRRSVSIQVGGTAH
jgi:hypothetical protein